MLTMGDLFCGQHTSSTKDAGDKPKIRCNNYHMGNYSIIGITRMLWVKGTLW